MKRAQKTEVQKMINISMSTNRYSSTSSDRCVHSSNHELTDVYATATEIDVSRGVAIVRLAYASPQDAGAVPPPKALENISVSALPSSLEPVTSKALGREMACRIKSALGARYSVLRKVEPTLVPAMLAIRKAHTFTSAFDSALSILAPEIFRQISSIMMRELKNEYCKWTGREFFAPGGSRYLCWLLGHINLNLASSAAAPSHWRENCSQASGFISDRVLASSYQ